ncbi:hypothetical protein DMP23_47615 [Amycolatopsis sp. A1MSW2902]|uniref:hypothetical protein n=1 Tax=Amycolatopsis sp. A1MSW2902 TaxID=687413 RepID=UPI00307F18E0
MTTTETRYVIGEFVRITSGEFAGQTGTVVATETDAQGKTLYALAPRRVAVDRRRLVAGDLLEHAASVSLAEAQQTLQALGDAVTRDDVHAYRDALALAWRQGLTNEQITDAHTWRDRKRDRPASFGSDGGIR